LAGGVKARIRLVSLRRIESLLRTDRSVLRDLAARAQDLYQVHHRRKKGGTKERHIDNPQTPLKRIQERINKNILLPLVEYPSGMLGGLPKRSAKMAAQVHAGRDMVASIDIRDFFPETSDRRVFAMFKRVFASSDQIAGLLTSLTTCRHRLPQGAPTSTTIGNLVLLDLYEEAARLARAANLQLSFYVDDISISGAAQSVTGFIEPLVRLLGRHQYRVRRKKVNPMPKGSAKRVLGLDVTTSTVSVGRSRIEGLRRDLVDTARQGLELDSVLRGRIEFVRYIRASQGESLDRLVRRLQLKEHHNTRSAKKTEVLPCPMAKGQQCPLVRPRGIP
jgi:hypothetical protein